MQIHAQGHLTQKDMAKAFRLFRRAGQRSWKRVIIGCLAGGAFGVIGIFIGIDYLLALFVGFVIGMFYSVIAIRLMMRRRLGRSSLLTDQIEYEINKDAIESRLPYSQSTYKWGAFSAVQDTPDLLVLVISESSMLIFPRRFFATDADWQAFSREARRRLGHCRACGYNLKGSVSDTCPECGVALATGTDNPLRTGDL